MLIEFLKAFVIGVCASAPIGPVAILVLQKSLTGGKKVGFITSMGSTIVDTLYAALSIFAVSLFRDFMDTHECLIFLVGGALVVLVGVAMLYKKIEEGRRPSWSVGSTLQCLGCALANPGAFAVMIGLIAIFNMDSTPAPVWAVVSLVALGCMVWWFFFCAGVSRIGKALSLRKIKLINFISGIIVILLGASLLVKGFALLLL